MKLKNLLACAALALFAAACSDDENNSINENPAADIAGTYAGYSEASFQYTDTPLVSASESLTITSDGENGTATLTYTSASFGEFTVSGAEVTHSGSTYSVSGSGSTLMGMGDTKNEYECTLQGTLDEGRTEGTFTFTVPSVMGGMTITFTLGDIPSEKLLAGSYEGWTNASCAYFESMTAENQTITLSANNDGTFTLAYTSDTWGEFSFTSISATEANGTYTLSGEGTTQMGMNGNVSEYPCTLSGSIDKSKENVSFTFTVPGVMGGLTITFTLGDMPAAN